MHLLRNLRSLLGFVVLAAWFPPAGVYIWLVTWPLCRLFPHRRLHYVSRFMRGATAYYIFVMRLAGARFHWSGLLPTDQPLLVLMNHQSMIDIAVAVRLARPYAPVFVARRLYGHGVPAVSPCIRLLGCPLVDPKRDRHGAVRELDRFARGSRQALLIFPEGHRSPDGNLQPFRPAGALTVLRARHSPVYLVVSDGAWVCRTFRDFVFNIWKVRDETVTLGPFEPPAAAEELPAFVEHLERVMRAKLEELRAGRAA